MLILKLSAICDINWNNELGPYNDGDFFSVDIPMALPLNLEEWNEFSSGSLWPIFKCDAKFKNGKICSRQFDSKRSLHNHKRKHVQNVIRNTYIDHDRTEISLG